MLLENWLSFVSIVFVFAVVPGPTVIFIIGQSLHYGKVSFIPLISGVLFANIVTISLSFAGLGTILQASAELFNLVKYLGIFYLIYLGIKTWREKIDMNPISVSTNSDSFLSIFKESFIVTAFNPKAIIFFMAFLPQFIIPSQEVLPQLMILVTTFLSIILLSLSLFAIFAGKVRDKIKTYQAKKRLNQVSGGSLIGSGIFVASM